MSTDAAALPDGQESMAGRLAFVTGAGSPMARELATRLARRGVRLVLADLDRALAAQAAEAAGPEARAIALDVADGRAVEAAVAEAAAEAGRPVDYLVNIAGYFAPSDAETISDEAWTRMISVHLSGHFFTCRAALPGMMAQRFGRIVNMSSMYAFNGQARTAHYTAAKAGIIGLTKVLAREKGGFNIRVNALAPGPVDTPLWRAGRTEEEVARRKIERARTIPLGRISSPAEIAEKALFLLGPESSFVTGQVLVIDGGETMA